MPGMGGEELGRKGGAEDKEKGEGQWEWGGGEDRGGEAARTKDDEKKKEISEDDRKRSEDEVQKLTDKYTAEADAAAEAKEKEIMTQ